MLQEELPASSRGPDQVYFSMLMVNDPNAALFGSLRPARVHPLVAALRRPFEAVPQPAPEPVESAPGLRPRWSRWIAAGLLLLGVGGAEAALERLNSGETLRAEPVFVSRQGATTVDTSAPALHAVSPRSEPVQVSLANPALVSTAPAGLASVHAEGAATLGVASVPRAAEEGALARSQVRAAPDARKASARATTSVKKKAATRQRQRAFSRALATRRNAR